MEVRRLKTDELQHHGILGMKWGIRRYQNKDGSLTEAGKKRYLTDKERRGLKKDTITKDVDSSDADEAIKEYKELGKDLLNIHGSDTERKDKAADTGLKALQDLGEYGIGMTGNYYTEDEDTKKSVKSWFLYEDQTFGMAEVADLANQGKSAQEIQNIVEKVQSVRSNKRSAVDDYIDKIAETNLSQYELTWSDKRYIEDLIFKIDDDFENIMFDIDEGSYHLTPSYIEACVKVAKRDKKK